MGVCRIIPLGGLGEVGKNMTVYEAEGSIVVVDAGLAFPRDEHLGVDLVLCDVSYLKDREEMVRGVVLTHGHEDHVGGLPYLMREVRVPVVVATRLTLGLVKSKLDEHGLLREAELREMAPDDEPMQLGPFRIELVFEQFDGPNYARALALARSSPVYREEREHDRLFHHAAFDWSGARDLVKLYEIVGPITGTEVLVDGKRVPYARELWLPLFWLFVREEPS